MFSASALSAGEHTVRVAYTGSKNASASDSFVNVDAFDVIGQPTTEGIAPVTSSNINAQWHKGSTPCPWLPWMRTPGWHRATTASTAVPRQPTRHVRRLRTGH